MKVLALTSSTSQASIAIGDESQTFERSHSVPRGHTEFMNSALNELLEESGWQLSELDLIAVDHGPGSFTGIRVSVSVARSLCYLLNKPAYMTESLDLLGEFPARPLIVGINAFKNLIFCALYFADPTSPAPRPQSPNLVPRSTSMVLSPAQLQVWVREQIGNSLAASPLTFVGDAWDVYAKDWDSEFKTRTLRPLPDSSYPKASVLLARALRSDPSTWTLDWKLIVPLYLRLSAAEENMRKP